MVIRHYLRTGEQHPSFVSSLLLTSSLALIVSCEPESPLQQDRAAEARTIGPDAAQAAAGGADGDDGMWPMPARTHAATRYSYQTEITRANVSGKVPDE
jgi:glucose dehydrogenase